MTLPLNYIRSILASIYFDACMNGDVEMEKLAALLEYLARQFETQNPHTLWQHIDIDKDQYDQPAYRNYLVRLKKQYYVRLADAIVLKIQALCEEDAEQAFDVWHQEYMNALVYWNSVAYFRLCSEPFNFDEEKKEQIRNYQQVSADIFDSRWDQVYPFFCEQAQNAVLPSVVRSRFAVYAGQVQLYHVMPRNDIAFEHFQMAGKLDEGVYTQQAFGEYHLKLSEYEKAREYFMHALSIDPSEIESYLLVGDTYRDEGEYETAEQWYHDALRINFMESKGYERLILLYAQSGKDNEDIKHRLFNNAEKVEIDHPNHNGLNELYRNTAHAFNIAGDLKEAENYYRRAINHDPGLVQAYIDLGYILADDERYEEAVDTFEKASRMGEPLFDVYLGLAYTYGIMENFYKAIDCYKKCLELLPSRTENIRYNLAYFYEKAEDYNTAKEIYKELIAENPGEQKYVDDLKQLLESTKDTEELERLLNELVENDPENPSHHNILGNFYFERQQFDKAVTAYIKAIELDDNEPVYWENLGLAYQNSDLLPEAEEAYQKASQLDVQSGRYLNRLGVFYNTIGEHTKAVTCYKEALEREPETLLYLSNLGIGYTWLNKLSEAEHKFREVLSRDPLNTVAHNEMATLLLKQNRYEEAEIHLEELRKLEPEKLVHLGNLGFIYQQKNDLHGALAIYNQALEIEPASDFYHNQAGVMHYWLGNYEEAKAHYNLAIQYNPNVELYYSNLALVLEDLNEKDAARAAQAKSVELSEQNHNTVGPDR